MQRRGTASNVSEDAHSLYQCSKSPKAEDAMRVKGYIPPAVISLRARIDIGLSAPKKSSHAMADSPALLVVKGASIVRGDIWPHCQEE